MSASVLRSPAHRVTRPSRGIPPYPQPPYTIIPYLSRAAALVACSSFKSVIRSATFPAVAMKQIRQSKQLDETIRRIGELGRLLRNLSTWGGALVCCARLLLGTTAAAADALVAGGGGGTHLSATATAAAAIAAATASSLPSSTTALHLPSAHTTDARAPDPARILPQARIRGLDLENET